MFETNADFDLNNDIFGDPFELSKPEAIKRPTEHKKSIGEACKKLRTNSKKPQTPVLGFQNTCESHSTTKIDLFEVNLNVAAVFDSPNVGPRTASCSSPFTKVLLRRFPGPAGLLPERRDMNIDLKAVEEANLREVKKDSAADVEGICSQMSVKAFQEGPWEIMSKYFRSCNVDAMCLPDKYNIGWIKTRATASKLINQKAPFLAAVIQSIECLNLKPAVVTVLLKDPTGEIRGTMVHDLYEEYIKVLTVGSVLILKQFGVLTTDYGSNHYITITANNLVAIYNQEAEKSATAGSRRTSTDNSIISNCTNENSDSLVTKAEIKLVTVQKFSAEDFWRNINEVKSRHKAELLEQKFNSADNFESICLNLRPVAVGSTTDIEGTKVVPGEGKLLHASDKLASPNFRNLSTRSISSSSVPSGQNSSKNVVVANSSTCTSSSRGSSTCNMNMNKENTVCNPSGKKPRFNFKKSLGILKKQSEVMQTSSSQGDSSKLSDVEATVETELQPVFSQRTNVINCSQISVISDNLDHSAILQNIFEGIDADQLFEDF